MTRPYLKNHANWPLVTLEPDPTGDVVIEVTSGGTPSTSEPAFWGGTIPWLTPKEITAAQQHRFVSDTKRSLTIAGVKQSSARLQPPGTVLLTKRAPVGAVAINTTPMATNQGFLNFRCGSSLKAEYLYWWLCANTPYLECVANGSTYSELYPNDLFEFELALPAIDEQSAITRIFNALQDKIEINRRISETLEAIARAFYKSWFMDFDPVRAKMSGQWKRGQSLPGLPAHLFSLFPDRLVDSDIGEIPEGWTIRTLGDLLDLNYGKALKSVNRCEGTIPVYGSNGQVGWHNQSLVPGPGIIVGRKGNPGVVTWAETDFFVIDTAFYVVPKPCCRNLHFLYYVLQTQDLPSLSADSAVPGLNRNLAYMSRQALPPNPILKRFEEISRSITMRMHRLEDEARTLAALRDALLNPLISGDIRLQLGEGARKEQG